MATIKKACKGVSYPKSSSVSKRLGSPSKAKKGGSFDLNKDGKTTFKDVLIGRGVLPKTAKKGMKVKKAQDGEKFRPLNKQRTKGSDQLSEYYPPIKRGSGNLIPVGAKKNPVTGKPLKPAKQKMGGKTKKCMYGCK